MSLFLHRAGLMIPRISPASYVFNGIDEYLERILSTSGANTTQFTLSVWMKTSEGINAKIILDSTNAPTFSNETTIAGTALERMTMGVIVSSVETALSQTGNDVIDVANNWTHYVWVYDTPNATEADRARSYKNGVQQADTQVTAFGLNEANNLFANGHTVYLGNADGLPPAAKKLAFMDLLEGVAAAPTDFAFDNGGTWTRKRYTGTYGTYGFKLDGTNGFNDTSGNGQNFSGFNMDSSNLDLADLPPYTN